MFVRTYLSWLAVVSLLILCLLVQTVRAGGTIVLLSFDSEFDPDAAAVKTLNLDVPVSYFFTGEYAMAHPDLVRRLADEGHTIGSHSHSHDHLEDLPQDELDKDLRLSTMVLEAISGVKVRWFRAPFLEYNSKVMRTARDVGLSHDSSDIADWLRNTTLPELAITTHNKVLASDYDIFEQEKMSSGEALKWLIDAYEARTGGQALVVLLHPRIIGKHAGVLHDFIAYVKTTGGTFQTMDAYSDSLSKTAAPKIVGLWVDLSFESVDPATLVSDARSIGVTDVFLSITDPQGINYLEPPPDNPNRQLADPLIATLRNAGIRVHAWIAVNSDVALATQRPELAMEDLNGTPSEQWISPFKPDARAAILENVRNVLSGDKFDGLHLDYVRFPGLDHGFSEDAISQFSAETGLKVTEPGLLMSEFYGDWVNWRMREIARLVGDIRQAADAVAGADLVFSAALIGDAAVNYHSREKFGQDYRLLAGELDLILPMAYYPLDLKDTDWVRRLLYAARWQAGNTMVATGLASFNQPGNWRVDAADMASAMDHSLKLTEGVVFYPYSGLFNRRDTESSVGEDVLQTVRASLASATRWPLFDIFLQIGGWQTQTLAFLAVALAFVALGLTLTGRQDRRLHQPEMATIRLPALESEVDWHADESACQEDVIAGSVCARISRRLRAIPANMLDAAKVEAILQYEPSTKTIDMPEAISPKDVSCLEGAVVTGILDRSDSGYTLTEAGHVLLLRLYAQGVDRHYANFLVRRMRETLTASCQHCGEKNRFHYFWPSFECSSCGRINVARKLEQVEIDRPDTPSMASRTTSHLTD